MSLRQMVARISGPPGFAYKVGSDGDRRYLQVVGRTKDVDTLEMATWTGRKWFLSPHMTETEVVNTALMATMAAMEHEVREWFTYEGVRLYDPHRSVRDLMSLTGRDVRSNPMEGA